PSLALRRAGRCERRSGGGRPQGCSWRLRKRQVALASGRTYTTSLRLCPRGLHLDSGDCCLGRPRFAALAGCVLSARHQWSRVRGTYSHRLRPIRERIVGGGPVRGRVQAQEEMTERAGRSGGQYSFLNAKKEPRMVPASFDFWLANLNREASSAGTSIPSDSLNPTARCSGSSTVYITLIDSPLS